MSTCHDTTIPELARDGLAGRGDDPVADLALQDPLCGARAIESRSTSSRPVTVMRATRSLPWARCVIESPPPYGGSRVAFDDIGPS